MAKQKFAPNVKDGTEPAEEAVSNDQQMYAEYVKGRPINSIAEQFKVEVSEVLKAITDIETARG